MNIYEYVQNQITEYPTTEVDLGYRQFNQYETIEQILAYTDSHYTGSQYDDIGRRKPFYNISNRILHKQRTAEDIDTKDIQIVTKKPHHYAKALLMTVANKKWMKLSNFALTLNKMTEERGKIGGVLVKKVINDGMLDIEVSDLSKLITDPTDIVSGSKIDPIQFNSAELLATKKNGWKNQEDAILLNSEFGDSNNTKYIQVYVVNGVLPRSYIDENATEFEYSEQMHVITLFTTQNEAGDDEQSGVTLFSSEDAESPYKFLPYEVVSKRSLGRGMVEQTFQAQISINEAVINEKNTMDIAGKVVFTQPKGNGINQNIITNIVDGTALEFTKEAPRVLQATAPQMGYNQTIKDSWISQSNNQSSVLDANTGDMPASATFRGMALQNQEANSIFELRREEMGIFLQEIYQDWVIPYLKKWVRKQEFLESELSSEQMQKVLNDFSFKKARKIVDDRYFKGEYNDLPAGQKFPQMALDTELEKERVLSELPKDKIWLKSGDKYLDGVEFDLDILITDEQRNMQVFLSNQVDAFNAYLANIQTVNSDPNAMKMLNGIQATLGQEPMEANPVAQPVEGQAVDINTQQ